MEREMHKKYTLFTIAAGAVFWAIYAFLPSLPVPGIEIGMVYSLGIIAVLILLFIMTYSLRKRLARGIPGRLDKWLWAHIYLGILALFIVALHAEFRFGWDYNTIAVIFLVLVVVTGAIGRYFYSSVPAKMMSEQENILGRLDEVMDSLDGLLENKSKPFQKIIGTELNTPSLISSKAGYWEGIRSSLEIIPDEEKEEFEKAVTLLEEKVRLESRSVSQMQYRPLFQGWLAVHLLVTIGLIVFIPLHILDDSFAKFQPTESDFGHPQECRQCHQRQYDEWIGSMHAYAQVSPVFVAFNDAVKNTGLGTFCVKCHTPIGIAIGEGALTPNEERADISLMGVQCDSCHIIEKNHGLVSGDIPMAPGRTKYGPFGSGKDGDPKAVRNSEHRSVQADFLQSSEFCGSCHDVVDSKDLRIEEAFTEWQESVYAEKGITCQDCHMRALPGLAGQEKVKGPAAIMFGKEMPERLLSNHSMIGPDNHLIDTFPYPDNIEENKRIQMDYLEKKNFLLQNCATLEIIAPETVPRSSDFNVEVKVENTGAGHGIPTGFTAERQVWIEIVVKDADGNVLFVSGDLDDNKDLRNNHSHAVEEGKVPLDEYLINFQSKFVKGIYDDGTYEEVLLPFKAFDIIKNNLMPFEPKSGIYPVSLPRNTKGPISVEARLRYRNLPPYLLDFLGVGELKDRLVINDMATGSTSIAIR